jgi:hypothetical protein
MNEEEGGFQIIEGGLQNDEGFAGIGRKVHT